MNENISNKELYNFIIEYEALCKKYKTSINGCGCCGSPFIFNKNFTLDNINFDNEKDELIFEGRLDFKNKKEVFSNLEGFKKIIADLESKGE